MFDCDVCSTCPELSPTTLFAVASFTFRSCFLLLLLFFSNLLPFIFSYIYILICTRIISSFDAVVLNYSFISLLLFPLHGLRSFRSFFLYLFFLFDFGGLNFLLPIILKHFLSLLFLSVSFSFVLGRETWRPSAVSLRLCVYSFYLSSVYPCFCSPSFFLTRLFWVRISLLKIRSDGVFFVGGRSARARL